MVEDKSNVEPHHTMAIVKKAKTRMRDDSNIVKRAKVGAEDTAAKTTNATASVECGLITTRQEEREDERCRGNTLIWNCSELSVKSTRKIIARFANIEGSGFSLKRIIQPDGNQRFDLKISEELETPMKNIHRAARALGARIRGHKPKSMRTMNHSPTVAKPRIDDEERKNFSVLSYNINGLWFKQQEAHLLLGKENPTVVAIQETLRKTLARSYVPRYQVIECPAKEGAGKRGLLLGVRRDSGFTLSEYEIEDWFIAGRVYGSMIDGTKLNMLIYSVYIPCSGVPGRSEAKKRLSDSLMKAWRKGDFSQIILMGDFNMDPDEVDRFVKSHQVGLNRVQSSEATRIGSRGGRSTIDHVISRGMDSTPIMKVMRDIDLSDHLPILVTWKLPKAPEVPVRVSLKTMALLEKKGFFLRNDRWETVGLKKSVDEMAEAFTKTVWEIAKDNDVVREYRELKWKTWMSKETLELIRARHEMAALRGTPLFNEMAYDRLWADSQASRKEDGKRVHLQKVKDMCIAGKENRFKDLWKDLKNACGEGIIDNDDRPVLDKEQGKLVFAKQEKEKVWAKHFEALAKDTTGNSRSGSYWESILPDVDKMPVRELCDDPLTWTEVSCALKATHNGKAAGTDKVPGELLKLTQEEEVPTSDLGKTLWNLLEKIWKSARIPKSYNSAMVVPIPKKGDLTDPDNYRGISLISAVLKIISKVVATRLHSIAERDNLLVKEQAGFRTREECVAQATALYEAVIRRSNIGKATYAVFIDFAKAYDKVPHMGMLRKLKSIGIKGHLFKVIEALYHGPKMCVKIGHSVTQEVNYNCGVRQGCPASPILFDLYINDIFEGIKGIIVPGLVDRIPGLLFADDAVALAESEEDLEQAILILNNWAIKWEMKMNVNKCGIIYFPPRTSNDTVAIRPMKIGDETIPVVDKYTYLGISIEKDLSKDKMARNNIPKGHKALSAMRRFLCRRTYPTHLKMLIVKAKLLPILTYGGELWGMNSKLASGGQKVLDLACRLIIRGGINTGLKRLRDELEINTIAAEAASKRFRALTKFAQLKTWIAILMANGTKCRFDTWVTGGMKWVKTYVPINEEGEQLTKKRLLDTFASRESKSDHTKATIRAGELGLSQDALWIELGKDYPELSDMLTEIGRMRVGVFPFGSKYSYLCSSVNFNFKNMCPICLNCTPETLEHLLLVCPRWEGERINLIRPCFLDWESMVSTPAAMTLAAGVLLGGERGIVANADTAYQQSDTAVVVKKGTSERVISVAKFLAIIIPIRRKTLAAKLSAGRRTSSWNQGHRGTVALIEP